MHDENFPSGKMTGDCEAMVADFPDELKPTPVPFEKLSLSLGKATALEVLRSFSTLTSELTGELNVAVRHKDGKQTSAVLRELSNSCRVIGAIKLQRLCVNAEENLHDPDWDQLATESKAIKREAQNIRRFANELLS